MQPPALAGFLFALFALALARGRSSEEVRVSMTDSLKAVASILMIIGAGGAFNDVLEASGISDAVSAAATSVHMPLLLLGWLLALALSLVAIGHSKATEMREPHR